MTEPNAKPNAKIIVACRHCGLVEAPLGSRHTCAAAKPPLSIRVSRVSGLGIVDVMPTITVPISVRTGLPLGEWW